MNNEELQTYLKIQTLLKDFVRRLNETPYIGDGADIELAIHEELKHWFGHNHEIIPDFFIQSIYKYSLLNEYMDCTIDKVNDTYFIEYGHDSSNKHIRVKLPTIDDFNVEAIEILKSKLNEYKMGDGVYTPWEGSDSDLISNYICSVLDVMVADGVALPNVTPTSKWSIVQMLSDSNNDVGIYHKYLTLTDKGVNIYVCDMEHYDV